MSTTENVAKRKTSTKVIWILVIVGLAAVAGHYGVKYYMESLVHESTDDAFIEGHVIPISPRVAGHVLAVHIRDNQHVKQGCLLVELDPNDFIAQVDSAKATMETAKAGEGQAKAQIESARSEANRTATDLKRYEEAAPMHGVSKQQLDSARAAAASAAAGLAASEKQIAVATARIQEANSALEVAQLKLSYTKIFAPKGGRVTQKSVEPGQYLAVGQPTMAIVEPDVWVVANFKETQLNDMKVGQKASIYVDAFPERMFKGHVESMQKGTGSRFSLLPPENATGNYVKVVQRVPVKIVFEEDANSVRELAPGMSVVPKVDIR